MARFPMYGMAGIGIAAAIGFVFILSSISSNVPIGEVTRIDTSGDQPGVTTLAVASTQKLNKFSSIDDLKAFLLNTESVRSALSAASGGNEESLNFGLENRQLVESTAPQSADSSGAPAPVPPAGDGGDDYSTTNVQVAGVDEPDFIKNDGKYAYVLSGDKLTIAEIYPAESAKVVAKVGLDIQQGQQLQNMFLNNNTLVVLYQEYSEDQVIPQYEFAPQPVYLPKTHAIVLDITDRASPKVTDNYSVTGAYSNARLIGDYAYLVTTSDLYNYRQPLIPKIAGPVTIVPDVYYFDNPEPYYNFNTVTSINIKGGDGAVNSKT
ncbi:MAG: beta-propeller domain-containing protein, partial [Nitrososphaera sp.]